MNVELPSGIATGVGSLPHRDARAAAEFVLTVTPDLPAVPSLPRRSPAEGMIAQAVVGIRGISLGQYGAIGGDVASIDLAAPVTTDLDHDAFGGLRAFVAAAKGRRAPITCQSVGPVTLGLALQRAGLPHELAFDVAARAVRDRVQAIHAFLLDELPACPQVLMIDEPSLPEVHQRDAPLAPDTAIDLVSGALAFLLVGADPVAATSLDRQQPHQVSHCGIRRERRTAMLAKIGLRGLVEVATGAAALDLGDVDASAVVTRGQADPVDRVTRPLVVDERTRAELTDRHEPGRWMKSPFPPLRVRRSAGMNADSGSRGKE